MQKLYQLNIHHGVKTLICKSGQIEKTKRNLREAKNRMALLNKESLKKPVFGLSLRWMPRSGPVLFVSLGNRQLGLAFFCHRQEDRCFKILGHMSFLCARCSGLCVGAFFAALLLLAKIIMPSVFVVVLCSPLLIDGFSQLSGVRKSNNPLRFFTGVTFSIGMIYFLFQR